MSPAHRYVQALILLLCSTVLLARTNGEHLHICLDGQEPSVSLHGVDAGLHHTGADAGTPHDDRDVELQTVAATKDQSLDSDSPQLLVPATFGALTPTVQADWIPNTPAAHFAPSPFRHLRPPLRGPPR
jgi:hypothetical protein